MPDFNSRNEMRPAPEASVEHEELDEAENQTDREAEREDSYGDGQAVDDSVEQRCEEGADPAQHGSLSKADTSIWSHDRADVRSDPGQPRMRKVAAITQPTGTTTGGFTAVTAVTPAVARLEATTIG